MTLEIKPKREGFSLDPGKILLSTAEIGTVRATIGTGSYTRAATVLEIPAFTQAKIPLKSDASTILALELDITPPLPEDEFFLDISGLMLHGSAYAIPRIRFEKYVWSGTMR